MVKTLNRLNECPRGGPVQGVRFLLLTHLTNHSFD